MAFNHLNLSVAVDATDVLNGREGQLSM